MQTHAFRHITKSSSAAGRTRHRLITRPAADDDFVIRRNARVGKCLCCQTDV